MSSASDLSAGRMVVGSKTFRSPRNRALAAFRVSGRSLISLVAVALAVPLIGTPVVANADEGLFEPQYQEFYTPPEPLPPGKPGDLIRSEPSRLVLEPSGQLGAYVATGTRIMYHSTDGRGHPVAVTGTYFEPDNAWPGGGPRPLIAFATGPYGLGDQCAPSRLFNQGIHFSQGFDLTFGYEETFIATMVARGFAVVVTDGVGLGTPGVPQFLNRLAAGQALIDAGRAAMQLPNTSLDPHGPVAFWGWSSGGQASASAAELASSYAPDLHVVGTWSGAPLADIPPILPFVDGNLLVGAIGYVLNGIVAAYPEAGPTLLGTLTDRGVHMVTWSQDICLVQSVADFGFRHLQPYFNADLNALAGADPVKGLLDAQRVGSLKPAAPVYISTNRFDSFSPWGVSQQLAVDWCGKGADVQFWTNEQPPFLNKTSINHLLPYFVDGERGMQWIADRFNGLPTTPNCGEPY